jgi:hypothetical protein
MLSMSANAFGPDWHAMNPQPSTLNHQPTGVPLNQERCFMSELQPSAIILLPFLSGSLAQFRCIAQQPKNTE